MKNFSVLVAVLAVVFSAGSWQKLQAQTQRYDAGIIVVDERILSPTYKQIAFIVTKTIVEPTTVQFQTMTLDGIIHAYQTLSFKDGLRKGQSIPLWNGDLTVFETTPWMNFYVTVTTPDTVYYTLHNVPVNQPEQYKELMINNIKDDKGSTRKARSAWKPPALIQWNSVTERDCPSLAYTREKV